MDMSKDLKKIIENKSIFLVIVVILAFIVLAVVIWGGFKTKMLAYQNQVKQKEEKSSVIKQYDLAEKGYNSFLDSIKKPLTPDALSNEIDSFASQNGVEVEISPQSPKNIENYVSTSFHLNVKSKDFKSLLLFIQAIEKSPYGFRVDSWNGKLSSPDSEGIESELNITSIQVKK